MLNPGVYTIEHLKPDSRRDGPVIGSAAHLRRKVFPAIRYVVPGYIAEGCTLLAGRPKLGKSWLMLEICLGVSMATMCLGGISMRGRRRSVPRS